MKNFNLSVEALAVENGMNKETVNLPNGKSKLDYVWKPSQLVQVFSMCEAKRAAQQLGKGDLVLIDGSTPTWLLPTLSHAFHPADSAVKYPQGGENCALPISGTQAEGGGSAIDLTFKVTVGETETVVEYGLAKPSIDGPKTLASLIAPAVPAGKPVKITGRGLIAIAAALAEAYAHKVPWVACFQPGTGFVVAISHSDVQLGTIVP